MTPKRALFWLFAAFIFAALVVVWITSSRAATVIRVRQGDDLQSKLNQAHCGDAVIADAGLTFPAIVIPNAGQCGANPVTFTTTETSLPRVFGIPDSSKMVKIVTAGPTPAVTFAPWCGDFGKCAGD